jgi:hypothetical protein
MFLFPGDEVGPYILGIQEIQYKYSLRPEGGADHADRIAVLPLGQEVAEAGEEIEGVFEAVDAEELAHIMDIEMEMIVLEVTGVGDAARGEIDTGDVVTVCGQHAGVPAPAAGHVEEAGLRRRLQEGEEAGDKAGGFRFVMLKIELMVVGGVEPFPEPVMGYGRVEGRVW